MSQALKPVLRMEGNELPQVSVVMPAYNAERTISEAIISVLNQTFTDFELIIINDCSKDSTERIVKDLVQNDKRIILLQNKKNSGVSFSRNFGVSIAQGEWIAFLDSDDIWRTDKLEKQLDIIKKHTNAVLSYTASAFIDSEGNPSGYVMEAEEKTTYSTLLRRNLVSCSSAMVKASVMKKIQMPSDKMHEDYYVWLTILKADQYAYGVNEPLLIYRLSSKSKSSNRVKSAKMIYNTYRAVRYGSIISLLLATRYSIHSITKRYKIKKYLGDSEK